MITPTMSDVRVEDNELNIFIFSSNFYFIFYFYFLDLGLVR